MRRGAALAVAACLVLASCSASGDDGARRDDGADRSTTSSAPPADRTTTTRAPERPPTGDEPSGDGDPLPPDVPDRTFGGLGDPRIDVQRYDVVVRADPGKEGISGSAEVELRSRARQPLETFTLDLRGPKLTSAKVDGVRAKVAQADDQVTITPSAPIPPGGGDVSVDLRWKGVPDQTEFPGWGMPVGWQADDDDGWFTMSEPDGTATWMPVNDHPSDKATWSITLDVPAGVTAIANGRLQGGGPKRTDDDRDRWRWREEEPMASYLALVAIGDYDLVSSDHGDVRVVRAFPSWMEDGDRAAFDPIEEILDFYSSRFGAYPNDDAGAIVVPTALGLALETQTRPLFGTDGYDDGSSPALAHELAHQWFGDAVTPTTWTDVWLNEGFATYADWMWEEHDGGRSVDEIAESTADSEPVRRASVRDPRSAGQFSAAVYEGGALTLHALRRTVGDDAFFRIVRRWVATYGGRSAGTGDLVAIASDEAGKDLGPFFDSWLDQAPQPALPR